MGNCIDGLSVSDRLAKRWGVRPQSARWMLYHMERGLRARCIDAIGELGPDALQWFAPVLAHLNKSSEVTLQAKLVLDAEENIAVTAYLFDHDGDKSDTRRRAILALEREAAAALAFASQLRAEEEAER